MISKGWKELEDMLYKCFKLCLLTYKHIAHMTCGQISTSSAENHSDKRVLDLICLTCFVYTVSMIEYPVDTSRACRQQQLPSRSWTAAVFIGVDDSFLVSKSSQKVDTLTFGLCTIGNFFNMLNLIFMASMWHLNARRLYFFRNVAWPTMTPGFEPGLIAHSESWVRAQNNSAKGSDPQARD